MKKKVSILTLTLAFSLLFVLASCASTNLAGKESYWESDDADELQFYSSGGSITTFYKVTLSCEIEKKWRLTAKFLNRDNQKITWEFLGDFVGDTTQDGEVAFTTTFIRYPFFSMFMKDEYFNRNFFATIEGDKITIVWNEPEKEMPPLEPFVLTRVRKPA